MRHTRTALAWTLAMAIVAVPAGAQHGGGSAKPVTPHASPTSRPAPASSSNAHAPAPVPAGSSSPSPKSTATPATANAATANAATANAATTTPAATAPGAPSTSGTLSPAQQKLQRNTHLASKLQSRLPPGTSLLTAAAGFRNLGQFVAAVNVSKRLGIPFAQLKTRMVDRGMSLGEAIQDARPAAFNSTTVAVRAERDADDLIRQTQTQTETETTKTRPTTKGSDRK
jgi:hypothetical protein